MKFFRILFLLTIIIFSFSCNRNEKYFGFESINNKRWSNYDTLYFNIDSSLIDLGKKYDVSFITVNNTEYLYQNLWLYVDLNLTKDNNMEEYEYLLADSAGKWYGSGFGSTYQLLLHLKKNFSFPEKRNYKIKVIHGMTDEPLLGIEKIGLKIQESN